MNLQLSISEIVRTTGGVYFGDASDTEKAFIRNVIIDSRSPLAGEQTLFIALSGKKSRGEEYVDDFAEKGGRLAIVSKKVSSSIDQIVVENPLKALQQLAQNHRSKFDIPVVGITGSNGKTVVKEWLYHTLNDHFKVVRSPKSYNSQIGVALSVLQLTEQDEIALFEAGISQPHEMLNLREMIQPTVGIFTGIGDAHSANFSSNSEKKKEKFILFQKVDQLIEPLKKPEELVIPFDDKASISNAQLVKLTAEYFGIPDKEVKIKLATLPTIAMRMEQISGKDGCTILNDSYSSDLQSLEIALKHIELFEGIQKKVLFLTPFEDTKRTTELANLLHSSGIDELVFFGKESELSVSGLKTHYYSSPRKYMQQALEFKNTLLLFKGSRKVGLEKIVKTYSEKKHVSRLLIDFNAIRNNLQYYRDQVSNDVQILAMVKAQSYGSGIVEMAKFLAHEKVDYLGVAYADEGITIRQQGIDTPIIVMNPEPNSLTDIIENRLEPSIYSMEALQEFIHELILRQESNYPIHIKLNTGMNRLGFGEKEIDRLIDVLETQPEVYVKSILSHLSVADDNRENEFTYGQIRSFEIMSGTICYRLSYPIVRHIANSAATLNFRQSHFDMVRLGIGMFGLISSTEHQLENALTFVSRISQVNQVKAGSSVGYGRSFIAVNDMPVGIVPVGYADGLSRALSKGKWHLIIKGKKAPIIGNICMDMCMVDLSGIDAKRGDDAIVFGPENTVKDMASALNTIPYEIISSISSRVFRVYLED